MRKICHHVFFSVIFSFVLVDGKDTVKYFRGDKDVKTNRPIIGILSQDSSGFRKLLKAGKSYIAASYVKYVEAAGARVIPIRFMLPLALWHHDQEMIFQRRSSRKYFPPLMGRVDLLNSKYARTAKVLFDLAMKANDKGDIFPIWGTCLGFEMLNVLASNGKHVSEKCDAENFNVPLHFVKDFKKSRMFTSAPKKIIKYLSTLNVTLNMHAGCVTVKTFKKEKPLNTFFRVISTNMDRANEVEFISTIEAYHYPFYGSQWHPEKNQFEWTLQEDINHSYQSVLAAQYVANFFVNQARMSEHRFKDRKEEHSFLIFNYRPISCFEEVSHFDECYFF